MVLKRGVIFSWGVVMSQFGLGARDFGVEKVGE